MLISENSIDNNYLKSIVGVITRTFFNEPTTEQLNEKKWRSLKEIYTKNPSYFSDNQRRRFGIECWPVEADSMVGVFRLVNIYTCLRDVIENKIEGDFVETGVWKGGSCVMANAVIQEYGENRRVHVFDSFEGLPIPYMMQDNGDNHHTISCLAISEERVKETFLSYDLLTDNVVFRKGWFKDTMQKTEDIEKISILRLDGDMYSSTIEVLEGLYDKVQIGGYIIIDDWTLKNAKQAVNDFLNKRELIPTIVDIDNVSCYWKKEKE